MPGRSRAMTDRGVALVLAAYHRLASPTNDLIRTERRSAKAPPEFAPPNTGALLLLRGSVAGSDIGTTEARRRGGKR